jgi:hypothetical protein
VSHVGKSIHKKVVRIEVVRETRGQRKQVEQRKGRDHKPEYADDKNNCLLDFYFILLWIFHF